MDCLQIAGAENPIDLDHIQLALQGYNFDRATYLDLAEIREYSRTNAVESFMKMSEPMD